MTTGAGITSHLIATGFSLFFLWICSVSQESCHSTPLKAEGPRCPWFRVRWRMEGLARSLAGWMSARGQRPLHSRLHKQRRLCVCVRLCACDAGRRWLDVTLGPPCPLGGLVHPPGCRVAGGPSPSAPLLLRNRYNGGAGSPPMYCSYCFFLFVFYVKKTLQSPQALSTAT